MKQPIKTPLEKLVDWVSPGSTAATIAERRKKMGAEAKKIEEGKKE